jgi:CheY-like chemotaxis protein
MMMQENLEILVVDDDEGHTELVRRHLRRTGIENPIVALNSGAAALEYVFREGRYAARPSSRLMILLDINMPGGVDGVDVLRRIKTTPERHQIPVVMLTTTDDPREIERCYSLGCNVYITKKVEPQAFINAVSCLGQFISVVCVPADGPQP